MSIVASGIVVDRAKEFGERLKALREAAGLTQSELSRRSTVPQQTISRYESGLSEAVWSNVLLLAQALEVDCTAFQGDA